MQLGDILDDYPLDVVTSSVEIRDVQLDSRLCRGGTLFFAVAGVSEHGARYAADAIDRGAVAVVSDRPLSLPVPVVVVPSTQLPALVAHASATVVGHPEAAAKLVGVTGTNGKTSVTTIVSSLARALEWNAGSIGTLTGQRTTPPPPELFRNLAALVAGFDPSRHPSVIAMEVSSHAIDQRRVEGLRFCVAAFTNLGHEHLDYHRSMEEYFAVKASLFTPEWAKRAVIWVDDDYGRRLSGLTSLPVTEVSRADASDVTCSLAGSTFFWRGHLVNSALVGDYNIDNALLAMTILVTLGADESRVARAMADVEAVPGRFEVIQGSEVTAIVDYAHTPEGLERLLRDVRLLEPRGRLVVVFGAGGDRDRDKRPAMGQIASTLADLTVVTSDNPRSESPDAIIDAVMSGVVPGASVVREVDRRQAIARAFESARAGDVVVIAGKGHETTQTVGDSVLPFDDREVARELLR